MTTFFVTYGDNHYDASGRSLFRSYSVVEAPDELAAHRAVAAVREGKWAFLYHSAEAAGVERFGLALAPLEAHKEPRRTDEDELLHNEPPR